VNNNIGEEVLKFYSQFARSSSPSYSWNNDMHYSIDAFYEGDLAMMINYSWHRETLRNKNAKLDFAIAPVPQLYPENPSNNANYWSFVVNKTKQAETRGEGSVPVNNKERIHEAWQFLKYLTFKNDGSFNITNIKSGNSKSMPLDIDPASKYLIKTNKPAARRDLAENQKTDPVIGPFAKGNIMAESWYRKDSEEIEGVWAEAITLINKGDVTIGEAFNLASRRIREINN
jgi:ABC-type glycerol-3-phosphate transport system substrate-binding protein